ncbi:MAG: hypothetical protein H0X37_10190 [Herpetosiphonaceae bacterium]|nr:hypothetical protein [Herpetosiphonaceae bacterium]
MPNEAGTCRKYVVPNLVAAGWDTKPHSFGVDRDLVILRYLLRADVVTHNVGNVPVIPQ